MTDALENTRAFIWSPSMELFILGTPQVATYLHRYRSGMDSLLGDAFRMASRLLSDVIYSGMDLDDPGNWGVGPSPQNSNTKEVLSKWWDDRERLILKHEIKPNDQRYNSYQMVFGYYDSDIHATPALGRSDSGYTPGVLDGFVAAMKVDDPSWAP